MNYSDNDGDGLRDNIIGYNYTSAYQCTYDTLSTCPLCNDPHDRYKAAFWEAIPTDWVLKFDADRNPVSWDVDSYNSHGVATASIAAARLEGDDIVGVASDCRIYVLRNEYGTAFDNARMILDAARRCGVMNMSWGARGRHVGELEDKIHTAAVQWDAVMVAATGNIEGAAVQVQYPANEEQVDVVAPVDHGIYVDSHTECLPRLRPDSC